MNLDAVQIRVLGALIEKEITTPENYPLSLNALIAACNQRSSRDPVLDLSEDEVRQGLHSLEDMEIVTAVRDARVPKYEHRIRTVLNLRRDETAILCLLLLRGPQTPGELRGRADRMYSFDDIGSVQTTLERLANRGSSASAPATAEMPAAQALPLVIQLPRQPGSRESRYAHLLGGAITVGDGIRCLAALTDHQADRVSPTAATESERLEGEISARLEARFSARIEALEDSLRQLQSRVEALDGGTSKAAALQGPPA
jgi:uncharacterized protein YceH (UPF0502 family)